MNQHQQESFFGCCTRVGAPADHEAQGGVRPLFFGRLLRILLGLAALGLTLYFGIDQLSLFGAIALGFLGLSFLVSGITANPGCELTALPNLARPAEKRVHFT